MYLDRKLTVSALGSQLGRCSSKASLIETLVLTLEFALAMALALAPIPPPMLTPSPWSLSSTSAVYTRAPFPLNLRIIFCIFKGLLLIIATCPSLPPPLPNSTTRLAVSSSSTIQTAMPIPVPVTVLR